MDLSLRRAALSDLDAIMALEESGFPPGIVEERPVFSGRITAFPEGFLLAGQPSWGYFCAEIWSGGESGHDLERFHLGHDVHRFLDRNGDTLYIASMTVAPAFRGGGRGRALFRAGLAQLSAEFPHLRSAQLIVNEHWLDARRVYTREGFVETVRLPAFFQPHEAPVGDAIVMSRRLQ